MVMQLETGDQAIDINTPEMLLDEDEQKTMKINRSKTLIDKSERRTKQRIENIIDVLGVEFNLDYDDITEQLNELYK